MNKDLFKFIIKRKDWVKIWDFHFSIWFLDRWVNVHLKFPQKIGNENRNTIHLFCNNSESAFFLQKEIDSLKNLRKKKILSKIYLENHYKNARLIIKKLNSFLNHKLQKGLKLNNNLDKLFYEYSNLFEELLSYYRASRPEIFEIVEEVYNKKDIDQNDKKYYKSLIFKYGKLRLDIKKEWLKAERKAEILKNRLAKLLSLNLEELEYLFIGEIKELIESKDVKRFKKLIKERRYCIFGIIKGREILITVNSRVKELGNNLEPKVKKEKEIIGKVANKGMARGKVKIIPQLNYDEMMKKANLFLKGEILVAGMTQPDIMFACRKAKAIITDEGGITSHAAIISRELNIPCIIGAKIATKVLHDGDLVEVDANKGIVKIINPVK